MSSSITGACGVGPGGYSCQKTGTGTPYQSQSTSCSGQALNITGIVQLMVSVSTWSTSMTCAGDPSSAVAYLADARCHATGQDVHGTINEYTTVNCNGGKPIIQKCADSACLNCTQSAYTGQCTIQGLISLIVHLLMLIGASVSSLASCVSPGSSGSGGLGNGNSANGAGNSLESIVKQLSAFAMSLVFFLNV